MINGKIWLSSPTMHGNEMDYIKQAFDTNWVAPLGENVTGFENEMSDYLGISGALALCSGTAALHLAVKLSGVKKGDIVFCSDMTFSATVNPVVYEGGVPVFIDSERDTWNMDPEALKKAFEKYPECKTVVAANLYGTPAKLDEIKDITESHGAVLIEDAAESLSATYKGVQTGAFGKYSAISFNGNKIITTSGGGMLLSDDKKAIDKARFWSTQSREPAAWYEHKEIGYNYRMSNIVAGIGRGQLKYLDEHKAKKREIYMGYKKLLKDLPVSMNPYLDCSEPNFWLSCILIDEDCGISPLSVMDELNKYKIETRPIWKPMHMQPVFKNNDFISAADKFVDEDVFARGLCLPSDIKMTKDEQQFVADKIISCFGGR